MFNHNFFTYYNEIEQNIKSLEKNIINTKPNLYHNYIVENNNIINSFNNVKVHDFLENCSNELKIKLLKLLTSCLKTHFFMFKNEYLLLEPTVFYIPDILNSKRIILGIYYPLSNNKCIIVSEIDLGKLNLAKVKLKSFPVVLSVYSKNWLNINYWNILEKEIFELKKIVSNKKDVILTKDNFNYGTIVKIDDSFKKEMKETGVKFNEKLKIYYVPKGIDLKPILEYYDYVKEEYSNIIL